MGYGYSKRGRAIGLALLLVALLVSGIAADPILDPLRDFLVRTATRFVSKSLGGSLAVGALRGSLLSSPVLHDVTLRDAQGEMVLQIEAIHLRYDLKSLLQKRLDIHSVEIVRPQLTLVQDADGQLNLRKVLSPAPAEAPEQPATPEESASGLPFALVLEALQLRDGQMTVRLPSLPGVRQVEGLHVQLNARLDQQGWRAQVQQVSARTQPADVALHTLQGAVQALGGVIQVDGLRLNLGETQLSADGVLPGGTQPASFALHLQPLALTDIGRLLQDDTLQGQVRLTLQANGPPEAIQVQGQLLAEQGNVDLQGQMNTAATPVAYQATLDVTNLNIGALVQRAALQSNLNVHLGVDGAGLSPAELRSQIQLTLQPSHLGDIALHPSQVNLAIQQQRLQVQRFDLHTSVAQLTASGTLDMAGASDLQYALTADVSGLQQLLGVQALAGNLHLQGQAQGTWPALRAHGTLTAQALRYQENRLASLRLSYDGAQLGDQPQVTAQLMAEQAHVGTLPIEQMTLDTTYQGATQLIRFVASVQQAAATGGQARGTFTLEPGAPRLVLEALQVQLPERTWQAAAPLQVAFTPAGIQLQQIRLVHADESIELTGGIAGEQLQDLRLHATQIDLSYLRRLLSLPDAVSGRGTLQVQLTGTLPEPQVQGDLTLQPGAEQRLPFEQFHTTLTYDQRRLQSTVELQQAQRPVLSLDLQLPIDLALTNLPLAQRLVQAPVDMHLHLRQPDLAAMQRWQPALPALHGTLHGTVALQGTYAHLSLDANVQLQRLGIAGSAEQVQAPVHLTGDIVTAESVSALVQAMQQGQVTPQVQNLQLRVPTLQGQLPAQGAPAEPFRVQDLLLQAAVQWTAQGLQASVPRLTLQASGLGLPPTDVELAARWRAQRLDLTRLRLRQAASEVQGQGHLTLPEQQVELRLNIPRLRLDTLPLTLPANLPALLQGELTLRGSVKAPQLEARLQYAGGQLQANMAAQLQEPLPRYRATLRLEGLELQQLLREAQGRLQASVQLQGQGFSGTERQASVELTAATQGLNLAPDVTTRLQASLSGEALRLQQFRLRSAPAELTASGTLSAARQVDLQYELRLLDVPALQPYVGVELQGRGGLRGQLQGSLEALQTRGTLQIEAWRVADLHGKRLQADFTAAQLPTAPQATLTAQVVEVQGPSLPPSALRLEGNYASQQGTFTMAVTAGPYEQTRLAGNVALGDGQRLTLNTLRLQHNDLRWENAAPVDIVRQPQGELHIRRLLLHSNAQQIRVQGTLLPQGQVQAEVHVQQLHLRPTIQAFVPQAEIPDGRLALDLTLSGTLQQPQLQGNVQLTALRWQEQDLGELLGNVELQGTTARTDLRWQQQNRQLLQARGTLGLSPTGQLDMHIQSPGIGLDILHPLSPAVTESAGTLQLDLRLAGTLQQPAVRGSLRLQDGVVALAATGERYRDIEALIAFAGDRVDIERLHVGSRSGPLQVTGQLRLAGLALQQVDVSLQAQEFTAMHTSSIEAVVSAAVEVEGPWQELNATGSVTIPRARLVFQELPGSSGPQKVAPWELTVAGVYGPGRQAVHTPGEAAAASPDTASPLPFLRADLQVDMPRNVWIQGPGTAVELSGNLAVSKERQAPFLLSGTIATVRGFASLYGKKFALEKGEVTFTGSPEINPQLNVTATREVSDYDIAVQVTGKAQQPTIAFSSKPELPQADILSLLLIGKTTDRLTSSERTSLSSQTRQIAGDVIASQLEKTLGKSLGLDTIEVTAGDQVGTGSVKVGRYVTQDIFLSFERELGGEDGNTVGVEYSLSRRLKLQGASSDRGETSIDLFWYLDY